MRSPSWCARCSTGSASVPDDVIESATGLGYGPTRMLFKIELPLALPVLMAGLRVATVSTVALTTVGTLVAYGGLGNLISHGVQRNFRAELVTAACTLRAAGAGAGRRTRAAAASADPLDQAGARMNLFQLTWDYLTTGSNWTGNGGLLDRLGGAAAAHGHRTGHCHVRRPADRAVAGPHRTGRVPRDQHLQHRPGDPDVRAARGAGHGRLAGLGRRSVPTGGPGWPR